MIRYARNKARPNYDKLKLLLKILYRGLVDLGIEGFLNIIYNTYLKSLKYP